VRHPRLLQRHPQRVKGHMSSRRLGFPTNLGQFWRRVPDSGWVWLEEGYQARLTLEPEPRSPAPDHDRTPKPGNTTTHSTCPPSELVVDVPTIMRRRGDLYLDPTRFSSGGVPGVRVRPGRPVRCPGTTPLLTDPPQNRCQSPDSSISRSWRVGGCGRYRLWCSQRDRACGCGRRGE
jgi:hypothetical protein